MAGIEAVTLQNALKTVQSGLAAQDTALKTQTRMLSEEFAELFANIDYMQADGETVFDASLDFNALTPEQYQSLIDNIKADLVFATEETCAAAAAEIAFVPST